MDQKANAEKFARTLYGRINAYFSEGEMSVKANSRMNVKIATSIIWWIGSYILMLTCSFNFSLFLLLYLFHAYSQIFFSFNVGHDALHEAISSSRKRNRLWAYTYDLLGVNTYMWRYMHHRGHHACLNIEGEDTSLATAGFFRLSTHGKWKPIHQYQHYYAFIVYGLYLPYYFFVKDYKYFFSKNHPHLKGVTHSFAEWVKLFLGKGIYFTYMVLIPVWYFDFGWLPILLAFFLALLMEGLVMAFTFQTTHVIDTTAYPKSNHEYDHYVLHVFNTTADYSTSNPVANWFYGGLNQHIIHHLRADICHIHYPELTKIVKKTAEEYGIEYRSNSNFFTAIAAHLRQLKKLGKNPQLAPTAEFST